MKHLVLAAATIFLITGAQARERWGPPPACPAPKVDCCEKPCSKPAPKKKCVAPKKCEKSCKPKCEDPCKPSCPPVCFERSHPTSDCCLPAAYLERANVDLTCGWNTFITASFTYWQGMQGGMDLALPGQAASITPTLGTVSLSAAGKQVLVQDFEFKPGFQVGLGWSSGKDGWTLFGEYTWVRGSTTTTAGPPSPGVAQVAGVAVDPFGVWIPTSWFPAVYPNNATSLISSVWDYGLDEADLLLSRPSYVGTHFILEPLCGIRGLWIRQSLDVTASILSASANSSPNLFRQAQYRSHSWGVGPVAGIHGKWLFCYGLRLISDFSASLLYTRYTQITQDVGTTVSNIPPVRMHLNDYDALRPNLDLSLGLGWGSYFCCRRFHFDLAASYDFRVFFQQNMMRYLADLTSSLTSHPDGAPSNFYLHGLTLKAEFGF